MAPKIERLTESYGLSEAPHWDIATQSLYFVDFIGQNILRYNPATKKVTKASTAPKRPTFIIPVDGKKDQFVISMDREIVIVSWDGESDKLSVVQKLAVADDTPALVDNKLNDGKCDSSGRLWTGTLNIEVNDWDKAQAVGSIYSYDPKAKLKVHADNIKISNGLAFNDKTKKFFYIDTLKGTVDQFDFDIVKGTISNRQVLFSLAKNNIPGKPDGMAIDADGNLWVAVFEGARVLKIDGSKPETLLDTVQMPAQQITSMTFGGPNLDELFVTTASFEHQGRKANPPENGAVYRVTGTGSRGLPADNFKLN